MLISQLLGSLFKSLNMSFLIQKSLEENLFQKFETLLSMERIAKLISFYHAQLWINHDLEQSEKQKHAPEYYQ